MKKLMLIAGLMLIVAPVMGAPSPTPAPSSTPVPTPSVTPTPVPADVPSGAIAWPYPVSLRLNFTSAVTDQALINVRNGQTFSVPAGQHFYVYDINWSCQSAVIGMLEFDGASSDQLFDYVYFPSEGQGKVMRFYAPVTSLDGGISPCVTTDRDATGWVYIGGELR